MATLIETISEGRKVEGHRPWPRFAVDAGTWNAVAARLADGQATLAGLWGVADGVHMAVVDVADKELAVVSLDCPQGTFPSFGRVHPPAIRLERAIADLFGLLPEGAPDARPWLDHGRWGVRHPLGLRVDVAGAPVDYPFLTAEGESLHQIPVGPVHAGIIEPGHFRFTANGETVVRLEERLGYVHKGIEALAAGADIAHGAKLAGRTSGDSTVAYGIAYAHAVEAALAVAVPPRAVWLRALMGELERLANHFGDVGAVCNDAAFTIAHAHFGVLRELVLRAAGDCFGHRLMRDRVVPGGVAVGLDSNGAELLRALLRELRRRFPALVELYDDTASVKDRTFGTGILSQALARQYGAGGFIGRASGRDFDARRWPGYPPYDQLEFKVPVLSTGDVNARVWVRIQEIEQSLLLIGQILDRLPAGAARAEVPRGSGEGLGLVEGFRGDILVWVRLGGGRVERCHLRDPSWFQWPLLEAVIEGNIVADFP
ncbi:MAG: NADH-quinone oxidoreductase subunit C, partial [Rhodospirillales bacterium]